MPGRSRTHRTPPSQVGPPAIKTIHLCIQDLALYLI